MKKHQHKTKSTNTKIQLKIKSKNVTNNFILTPRTASVVDQTDTLQRLDKFTEEIKSQKDKKQESAAHKPNKDSRKPQYRMVSTDHPKIVAPRKKYEEDETGTHTPLLKRVSFASEIGNKKKSTQSLVNTQRSKPKNKTHLNHSNGASSQLNQSTLQRLIGVIIKDYREGRLKQKELEQTLMELYDRRETKKSLAKGKKKKTIPYNSFSNEYIKSANQIKSEALVRKAKKNHEIHQSVLQRKGFVHKIIIKGITTSLFLKEDGDLTNIKESDAKVRNGEPSYQINTSNSIKQIYEDMANIKEQVLRAKDCERMCLKDRMAIRIQRAWRRYRTRKILLAISKAKNQRLGKQAVHIIDEFTDQQNDEPYDESTFTRNIVKPNQFESEFRQISELVNIISNSLQDKHLTKQECLQKILQFLHLPSEIISNNQQNVEEHNLESQNQRKQSQELLIQQIKSQEESIRQNRVIIFNQIPQSIITSKRDSESQGEESNELNSFTNKYSSKEVKNANQQSIHAEFESVSEVDESSLTYVHSQTARNESFKMINIRNIEQGLKGREESLQLRKQREIDHLTEQFFIKKISKEQYAKEKDKIEKWFTTKQKELKKVKNSLLKSCMEAKSILENDTNVLKSEKSQKMLKCLSDKYIKKQDWLQKEQNQVSQKKKVQHVHCEENQFDHMEHMPTEQVDKLETDLDDHKQVVFNQIAAQEDEWQASKGYQISPKLSRHTSLDQNQYKYEQIERIISEDDDDLQNGVGNQRIQSDKFINVGEKEKDYISAEEISLINNYVNETSKKFKYLCTEDKEDIFQFLFLDLVLEMFTESYPGQSKVLRAAEAYIQKAKRLRKIPKGIKTNLASCKQYLRLLNEFVLKQQNGLKGLLNPMGPTAAEMLRYMRDQIIETQDDENISSALVLSVDVFERLGKTKELELKLQRYYEDEEKEFARVSFLKTALHINNKALFDSLNEMLDHERPYGVWGKPFPWKKELSIDKKWSTKEQQAKLKASIDKTIECCSYLCGILVEKEDSLFGNHRVSQEYIMQIREDRLSKMLANDLIENEERWIFYDDQQTEILMETSSFITKKLIKELVLDLVAIRVRS